MTKKQFSYVALDRHLNDVMNTYSAFLYQEAHAMVRAAKVKQVGAEKRFKEANNKVSGIVTPLSSQCYSCM